MILIQTCAGSPVTSGAALTYLWVRSSEAELQAALPAGVVSKLCPPEGVASAVACLVAAAAAAPPTVAEVEAAPSLAAAVGAVAPTVAEAGAAVPAEVMFGELRLPS